MRAYGQGVQTSRLPSPCSPSLCSHLCLLSPSRDTFLNIFDNNLTGNQQQQQHNNLQNIETQSKDSLSYACSCPIGIKLGSDGKTCKKSIDHYMILASTKGLFKVSLETRDYTMRPLDNRGKNMATARYTSEVDFDPIRQEIYWYDDESNVKVSKELPDGHIQTRKLLQNIEFMDDFALDILGRNLYWTHTKDKRIYVASIITGKKMVAIFEGLDQPIGIALHPSKPLLVFSDWGEPARIERSALDGTDRKVIVNTGVKFPKGVALDGERVYWADSNGEIHHIESCQLSDGSDRRVVISSSVKNPFKVSVLDNRLYWFDWANRDVASLSLVDKNRTQILRNTGHLMDIVVIGHASSSASSNVDNSLDTSSSVPSSVDTSSVTYNSDTDSSSGTHVDNVDDNVGNSTSVVSNCYTEARCSHLCFRMPEANPGQHGTEGFQGASPRQHGTEGFKCACPPELEMSDDGRTCVKATQSFLLYASGGIFFFSRHEFFLDFICD